MCLIWNETHRKHKNEFLAHIDSEFDLKESVTWDEMKERLATEKDCLQAAGINFVSSAGTSAYASVPSTMLQVECTEDLDEDRAAEVKQHAKCEKDDIDKMEKICKGTQLQMPLHLVEKLKPQVKLLHYPSGYKPTTRTMIMESVTVFNLNDIHPAFYKLGNRLADMSSNNAHLPRGMSQMGMVLSSCDDDELRQFLQRVRDERFEQLIQFIANEEDVAETGFSPETAESFLSEEEKEGKSLQSTMRPSRPYSCFSAERVEERHRIDA